MTELINNPSIEQRAIKDVLLQTNLLINDCNYQPEIFNHFFEIYLKLKKTQQQWIRDFYKQTKCPLFFACIQSNVDNDNLLALNMLAFLFNEGFSFNKYDVKKLEQSDFFDLSYFKQENNSFFKKIHIKISKKQKTNKRLNKNTLSLLIKHYQRLPNKLQSIVIRDIPYEQLILLIEKQS